MRILYKLDLYGMHVIYHDQCTVCCRLVFLVYSTCGAFDIWASHGTISHFELVCIYCTVLVLPHRLDKFGSYYCCMIATYADNYHSTGFARSSSHYRTWERRNKPSKHYTAQVNNYHNYSNCLKAQDIMLHAYHFALMQTFLRNSHFVHTLNDFRHILTIKIYFRMTILPSLLHPSEVKPQLIKKCDLKFSHTQPVIAYSGGVLDC